MLFKLALSGAKSRLKDYVVLFSGLTISSAIFYMFLSLALNNKFLSNNSMLSSGNTTFVFAFGVVLLAIITLVYIVYANSFLLSMRQRDYGMFLMLGAKTGKIGTLIFLETMLMGTIATIIGVLLGVGLTQVVSGLLISQLDLTLPGFVGLYIPAVIATILFFVVLFFIAALFNRRNLVKTPVLELLHGQNKPVKYRKNSFRITVQAVLGVISLAVGYWSMANVQNLVLMSIPIALVTIVLGSYLVFNSLFIAVINLIRKNHRVLYRGLRSFTLNQLRFRITDYTRILSVISILFALALGAITVGLGFDRMAEQMANSRYFDAQIFTNDKAVKDELKDVAVKSTTTYHYKEDAQNVYLNKSEFERQPLKYMKGIYNPKNNSFKTQLSTYSVAQLEDADGAAHYELTGIIPNYGGKKYVFLTDAAYSSESAQEQRVQLLKVVNFQKDVKQLTKIQTLQVAANPKLKDISQNTKPITYQAMHQVFSGFEFMGFFLGIAFLTMLASTLMFKILSGAQSDVARYEMLSKIGVKERVLKNSITKEIAVLFALPGILGIVHVLFGLQFFKAFLLTPYQGIWLPFTIFIALYGIYYLLTTYLYRSIVLKKTV
ncbi:ABC superfamily ATP binding cassette transporter permease protein [Amylolactobacillus amylotrophicus DSM 20534]|uniref:ABC superfamily ATP binding cassette transporter permease protein n=3 Tax=Amylolactobacillus TaxID=2767876 RepID=A0A0R1YGR0_9LACO|nr:MULTISPECIES: FtsX-like permease family protein [Amylolactobacillus]APT18741.1 ABC transporter [Amylolactobacillus amylophilus DSM 20533 = JCM 1125]KRK37020.1 ABC superfamily ATP binding cassette transporter permease protein [Amylolactobacillus amylotrophicus DSM 20534]KRM41469.1 ABC superfamily ATP binding cassette transporter permease protein [Amylolactobacillus amylophilus DSM 20533 = JCM 1125]GED80657.1 ABC transporter permease [Amylolactobacillus amylophilus]